MEVVEIQDTAQEEVISVVVGRLADADLRQNQSEVTSNRSKSAIEVAVGLVVRCFTLLFATRRGEDEEQRSAELVETANIQTMVPDEENPDSIAVDQLTASDHQVQQSPFSCDHKSVIQAKLTFAGGSFVVMYTVPGGVNEVGMAVMCDTVGFIIFLIADMVAMLASLLVAMIVATASHTSPKMNYLICMSLWVAGVSLLLSFHAAAYVVVLPKNKWVVLWFGGAAAVGLALLLLNRLSTIFRHVSGTNIRENGGMHFLNGLEGGHFSRAGRRGQHKKRRKI